MNNKNLIVVPPYYYGTSLDDIVRNLKAAASNANLSIKFIGCKKPLQNRLDDELLDDEKYLLAQLQIIDEVMQHKDVENILFLDFFNFPNLIPRA